MGTLTETRAIPCRTGHGGGNRGLATALHLDLAYLLGRRRHAIIRLGAARTGVFDHVQRRGVRRRLRFPVGRRHGGVRRPP